MNMSIASANINITSNIGTVMNQFSALHSKIMGGFNTILAVTGITSISYAIKELTMSTVEYSAKMEGIGVQFDTIFSTKGKGIYNQLKQIADLTPFEMPGLATAAAKLGAFGFKAEQIPNIIYTIGNAASALNIGEEGIQGITLALGQMAVKGKITGEEMMQLNERGLNVTSYLAEHFKKTEAQIISMRAKGLLPLNESLTGILNGMKEDPKFAGALEKQSKILNGLWSTMKDTFNNFKASIFEPYMEPLKKLVSQTIDFTRILQAAFKKNKFEGIWNVFKFVLPKGITTALEELYGRIKQVKDSLFKSVNAKTFLEVIIYGASNFLVWFDRIIRVVKYLWVTISQPFRNEDGILDSKKFAETVTNIWVLIKALAALGGIITFIGGFGSTISTGFNWIRGFTLDIIGLIGLVYILGTNWIRLIGNIRIFSLLNGISFFRSFIVTFRITLSMIGHNITAISGFILRFFGNILSHIPLLKTVGRYFLSWGRILSSISLTSWFRAITSAWFAAVTGMGTRALYLGEKILYAFFRPIALIRVAFYRLMLQISILWMGGWTGIVMGITKMFTSLIGWIVRGFVFGFKVILAAIAFVIGFLAGSTLRVIAQTIGEMTALWANGELTFENFMSNLSRTWDKYWVENFNFWAKLYNSFFGNKKQEVTVTNKTTPAKGFLDTLTDVNNAKQKQNFTTMINNSVSLNKPKEKNFLEKQKEIEESNKTDFEKQMDALMKEFEIKPFEMPDFGAIDIKGFGDANDGLDKMNSTAKGLAQSILDITKNIVNMGNVTERVSYEKFSVYKMQRNMTRYLNELKKMVSNLDILKGTIPQDMLNDLRKEGLQGAGKIKALSAMTDAERKAYIGQYQEAQGIAGNKFANPQALYEAGQAQMIEQLNINITGNNIINQELVDRLTQEIVKKLKFQGA
jgi:tape measure domain-containing protein